MLAHKYRQATSKEALHTEGSYPYRALWSYFLKMCVNGNQANSRNAQPNWIILSPICIHIMYDMNQGDSDKDSRVNQNELGPWPSARRMRVPWCVSRCPSPVDSLEPGSSQRRGGSECHLDDSSSRVCAKALGFNTEPIERLFE